MTTRDAPLVSKQCRGFQWPQHDIEVCLFEFYFQTKHFDGRTMVLRCLLALYYQTKHSNGSAKQSRSQYKLGKLELDNRERERERERERDFALWECSCVLAVQQKLGKLNWTRERERERDFVLCYCVLAVKHPSSMLVCLRDGSAETIVHAATRTEIEVADQTFYLIQSVFRLQANQSQPLGCPCLSHWYDLYKTPVGWKRESNPCLPLTGQAPCRWIQPRCAPWFAMFGVTRGVMVSMSAFLTCDQCYCVGSSPGWGLTFQALVCGIFWSSSPAVFFGYSSFLPSFIGLIVQPI